MTRQELIDKLMPELTTAIREVIEDSGNEDTLGDCVGWTGENTYRLMAKAALAVFDSVGDVQDWMKQNNVIKSDDELE